MRTNSCSTNTLLNGAWFVPDWCAGVGGRRPTLLNVSFSPWTNHKSCCVERQCLTMHCFEWKRRCSESFPARHMVTLRRRVPLVDSAPQGWRVSVLWLRRSRAVGLADRSLSYCRRSCPWWHWYVAHWNEGQYINELQLKPSVHAKRVALYAHHIVAHFVSGKGEYPFPDSANLHSCWKVIRFLCRARIVCAVAKHYISNYGSYKPLYRLFFREGMFS